MRAMLLLLAVPCLASCDSGSSESSRQPRYEALAKRFGQAVLKGDFLAAYSMTSRLYQASNDLSAFRDLFDRAREEYGEPTYLEIDFNTLKADGPLGDDLGFPDEVKVKDRRARMVVILLDEADGDVLYEVWLNVIAEDGGDRIVTVEIPGINM